jgi:transcriptional regulator with XRE-family HTH domain
MAIRMERRNEQLVAAFAVALSGERKRTGLTQEELAARADVSARFVSQLETAKRQPSLTALHALSAGLGMSLQKLTAQVELHYGELIANHSNETEES